MQLVADTEGDLLPQSPTSAARARRPAPRAGRCRCSTMRARRESPHRCVRPRRPSAGTGRRNADSGWPNCLRRLTCDGQLIARSSMPSSVQHGAKSERDVLIDVVDGRQLGLGHEPGTGGVAPPCCACRHKGCGPCWSTLPAAGCRPRRWKSTSGRSVWPVVMTGYGSASTRRCCGCRSGPAHRHPCRSRVPRTELAQHRTDGDSRKSGLASACCTS
jgi:hypothetical protein